MNIKPIETRYKGHRFRSRLEARWAVFFDAMGLQWRYEPEGFDLGEDGRYLPDFHIADWDSWVEIKGRMPTNEELKKFFLFTRAVNDGRETPKEHFMLCGTPGGPEICVSDGDDPIKFGDGYAAITTAGRFIDRSRGGMSSAYHGGPVMDFSAFAMVDGGTVLDVWPIYIQQELESLRKPWKFKAHNVGRARKQLFSLSPTLGWIPRLYMGKGIQYRAPNLMRAYTAARSARFEHGENGQ